MDRTKILRGLILLIVLTGCSANGKKKAIRVGSKNFTEQVVLGEIIAQHLQNRLPNLSIERRLNLGGTLLAHQALRSGELDLYPEYTGTALAAVLKAPLETDPAQVLAHVRAQYQQQFQVDWLDPLGIDDTFAMVVSGKRARTESLTSLTDAIKSPAGWILGEGYEFAQRTDGLAALNRVYHLRWTAPAKTMDLGLLYQALEQGQVTMAAANSTDGMLAKLDVKVLTDDRHAFPPYQLCIAAREDTMRDIPGVREVLAELSGKFTNRIMQDLNYQVDALHRPVAEVAAGFLKQARLK